MSDTIPSAAEEFAAAIDRDLSEEDFANDGVLGRRWHAFWMHQLATLIREKNPEVSETPGVHFLELTQKPYEFEPYLDGAVRRSRRVFRTLELESLVEDRSFSDYRLRVEQEFDELVREASDLQRTAELSLDALAALRARLPPDVHGGLAVARGRVDDIVSAVLRAREIAVALKIWLRDESFRVRWFDRLRVTHGQVQDDWGTWQRRVRDPVWAGLVGVVVALVGYVTLGSLFPSRFLVPMVVLLPLAIALHKYYRGRSGVNSAIRKFSGRVAPLNPDDQVGRPRRDGVWTSLTPSRILNTIFTNLGGTSDELTINDVEELGNRSFRSRVVAWRSRTRDRLRDIDAALLKKPLYPSARTIVLAVYRVVAGVLSQLARVTSPVTVLFVLVLVGTIGMVRATHPLQWPTHQVLAPVADGSCLLAEGVVYWPGPVDIVVGPQLSDLMFVPVSRVGKIQVSGDASAPKLQPCSTVPASRLVQGFNAQTVVYTPKDRVEYKGVLVIPFAKNDTIPCEFSRQSPGIALDRESKSVLRHVREALGTCAQIGSRVRLDVKGFASSEEFACASGDSAARNLQVGNYRRLNVLAELDPELGKSVTAPVESKNFIVEPASPNRFESVQHMADHQTVRDDIDGRYNDALGALSRRAEIWFKDLGGCGKLEILTNRVR